MIGAGPFDHNHAAPKLGETVGVQSMLARFSCMAETGEDSKNKGS